MIKYYRTRIEIHNYNIGDCIKLERLLTHFDKISFSIKATFFRYDDEEKILTIPAGIGMNYIQYLFPNKQIVFGEMNPKVSKNIFIMKNKPRSHIQQDAINFLSCNNQEEPQKMLCLATGTGKTFSALSALSTLKSRGIIFVASDALATQWKNAILEHTNILEQEIFIIQGKDSIEKAKNKINKFKIFITTFQTINNYIENENNLNDLLIKLNIDTKIFDESHSFMSILFKIDMLTNVDNTFYLTATPNRSDKIQDRIYKALIKDIPIFGLDRKFDEKYLNVVVIEYNTKPSLKDQALCKTPRGFSGNAFADYLYEYHFDYIYKLVKSCISKHHNPDKKIAIIMQKNEHIIKMKERIESDFGISVGTFTSLVPPNKKELEKEKSIFLTTEKSMGNAIDCKDLKYLYCLIAFSSDVVADQLSGRLRKLENDEVYMYDFCNIGFTDCKNQLKSRLSLYNKKAKSIKRFQIK